MARRSIWNGAISFGMVVIPVKLYNATDTQDISFVNLHSTCHTRLRQPRYCPHHQQMVEASEIVRGYEYGKDQYVIMEDSDFEDLPVPSKRTIEIIQFIVLADIDPIFYDRSYALEPLEIGVKPYYLLKQALESTQKVAIAKVSIRQREHLCCLRPYEHGILLETMHYPVEIRGMTELALPEGETTFASKEMEMAVMLIDQLTREFEPSQFTDGYREALERVIEAKLGSSQPVKVAPVATQGRVANLMDALKASIEATKSQRTSQKTEATKTTRKKATTTRRTRVKTASS